MEETHHPHCASYGGKGGKLLIPFAAIEDHIQCSICLSAIRGAVLTPCGHRYCTRCITEWVGRNHKCPCCNSDLDSGQLYYDVQFDGLVDTVLAERDKAEEEYYKKLFGSDIQENSLDKLKPNAFENILKKHMKESMVSHQRYFDNLYAQYRTKIDLLDKGITKGILPDEQSNNAASVDEIKAELTKNLEESETLAANAFDRYLKNNVPSLEVVPVTISIYIADKNVRVEDVVIAPSDRLSVIKPVIEAAMKQRSNDIISWKDEGGTKLLYGPLRKCKKYDFVGAAHKPDNNDSVDLLHWDSKLIFQYNMRPGSEIVLHQVFQCQSDLPKECFRDIYVPNSGQTCDYFTCNKCQVKWICKSCIQCCHEGHSISPFALNHTPTWACCYCPKKGLCWIQSASKAVHQNAAAGRS